MKSKPVVILKIYLISLILSIIISLLTAVYFYFSDSTVNPKNVTLFVGIIAFATIGFLFSNYRHKKGLLSGIIIGFITSIVIILILVLMGEQIKGLTYLKYSIYIISSGVFGIFGVNFKKIIK